MTPTYDFDHCATQAGNHLVQCVADAVWADSPGCTDEPGHDTWRVLRPGQCGDCEDHAITIGASLIHLGMDPSKLKVLITKDWAGRGHAVLIVSSTTVLDNRHLASAGRYERVGEVTMPQALLRAHFDRAK